MTTLAFDRDFDAVPGEAAQISPLVRRVLCANPSPFTFKGTSSFIVGKGQVAIIDPGPLDEAHLAALTHAVRGETVTHILITHSHADHSPLAARLQELTGAVTVGYGQIAATATAGLDASTDHSFAPDQRMAHGDTLTGPGWTLQALFTPGHMSNHLCFASPEEQALFTGDHVMSWATSVVAPPDGNMGHYMASLRALLSRDDAVYLPAHGPSRPNPKPWLQSLITHREQREAAILACINQGHRSISAIVAQIYPGLDPKLHAAAGLSTQAHVQHLVEQGLVAANVLTKGF